MGNKFIFDPPSSDAVYQAIRGEKYNTRSQLSFYHSQIAITQAFFQILIILTVGLVIFFSEKRVHTSS